MGQKLILLSFAFLFVLSFSSAEISKWDYTPTIEDGANYSITVNDTNYLQGLTPQQVADLYNDVDNSTGLIRDWNITGLIMNWTGLIYTAIGSIDLQAVLTAGNTSTHSFALLNTETAPFCQGTPNDELCYNNFYDQPSCEDYDSHNSQCFWLPYGECYGDTFSYCYSSYYGDESGCNNDPICGVYYDPECYPMMDCYYDGYDEGSCNAMTPVCSWIDYSYCENADTLTCSQTSEPVIDACSAIGGCVYEPDVEYKTINASIFISNAPQGMSPFQVISTTKVDNLNADYLDGLHSSSFIQGVTATLPLTVSGTTTRNIVLNYNTANLKITSNQLNTIQDIATTSSPTFAGMTVTGTGTRTYTVQSSTGATRLNFDRIATNARDYQWEADNSDYFGLATATNGATWTKFLQFNGSSKQGRIGDAKIPTIGGGTWEVAGTSRIYSPMTNTYMETGYSDTDVNNNNIYEKHITNQVLQKKASNFDFTPNASSSTNTLNLGQTYSIAFTTTNAYALYPYVSTGANSATLEVGTGQQTMRCGGRYAYVSTPGYGVNRWVWTRSGTSVKLYKNGVSQTVSTNSLSGDYYMDTFFDSYRFAVDEIITFNKVLSQDEVDADYRGGLIKRYIYTDSGVTHIWHFDENQSGIIYDAVVTNPINKNATGTYAQNSLSNQIVEYPSNLLRSYSDYNYYGDGFNEIGDHYINTKILGLSINADLPIKNNVNVLNTAPYKITPVTNGGTFATAINSSYNSVALWTEGVSDSTISYVVKDTVGINYIAFVNGAIKIVYNNATIVETSAGDLSKRHKWFFVLGGWGNNKIMIVKDGVSFYSVDAGFTQPGWSKVLVGSSGDETTPFSGIVDELIIWSEPTQNTMHYAPGDGSALTTANVPVVLTDWNNGEGYYWTSGDRTPRYIYHFDEGSGTTASSSNVSNTITFGTAPTWSTSTMSRNMNTTERSVISKEGETTVGDANTFIFGDTNVDVKLIGRNALIRGINITLNGSVYVIGNLNQTNGNAFINNIYGAFYYENDTGYIVDLVDVDVYVNTTNWSQGISNGMTMTNNNSFQVNYNGIYDCFFKMTYSDGADGEHGGGIFVNDVKKDNCYDYGYTGTSNAKVHLSNRCNLNLTTSDIITVEIDDHVSPVTDPIIYIQTVNCMRVGN